MFCAKQLLRLNKSKKAGDIPGFLDEAKTFHFPAYSPPVQIYAIT